MDVTPCRCFGSFQALRCCWWSLILASSLCSPAAADTFTVLLDDRREVEVSARFTGEGQGAVALEMADGQLQVVPADRILKRTTAEDPTPLTCDEILPQLLTEFGAERLLTEVDKPFVLLMVRSSTAPLDPAVERQYQNVLKKAAQFFRGMQNSFLQFVKQARVETTPVRYPLVALIFESDRQFDAYTASVTGQDALSPQNIAAFYDLLTNRLVIRLRECKTFDTPLHEAVHQQVYNRGILQRLAPVPAWFNEGIATGFEGDGERVRSGPKVVSDRYGRLALKAQVVQWPQLVGDDQAFQGDVLAAEAYGHAWGMHWLLVNKYRTEYNKLVRHYASKKPLSLDRPDVRQAEFEAVIGKTTAELQQEFYREVTRSLSKRTK